MIKTKPQKLEGYLNAGLNAKNGNRFFKAEKTKNGYVAVEHDSVQTGMGRIKTSNGAVFYTEASIDAMMKLN